MSTKTQIQNRLQRLTNSIVDASWLRLAGALVGCQIAIVVLFLYLEAFAMDLRGDSQLLTLSLGIESIPETLFVGVFAGALLSPAVVVVIGVLGRMIPVRKQTAQTVGLWFLVCPAPFAAALLWSVYTGGENLQVVVDMTVMDWVEAIAVWSVVWTVFAAFAGMSYSLATGSLTPTDRKRQLLLGAAIVLIAIPMAVGFALPADDDLHGEVHWPNGTAEQVDDPYDYTDENTTYDSNESVDEWILGDRNGTDPDTYDDGKLSPRIRNATAVPGDSEAVRVSGVDEDELPGPTIAPEYPVAELHTDGDAISVSDIQFEFDNETVVPKARYHVTIDGANTSPERRPGVFAYRGYSAETESGLDGAFVYQGSFAGLESGYFIEMEALQSTHVFFDVVNDDGGIERYVAELERTDR